MLNLPKTAKLENKFEVEQNERSEFAPLQLQTFK